MVGNNQGNFKPPLPCINSLGEIRRRGEGEKGLPVQEQALLRGKCYSPRTTVVIVAMIPNIFVDL
jgi:hypothetical protein